MQKSKIVTLAGTPNGQIVWLIGDDAQQFVEPQWIDNMRRRFGITMEKQRRAAILKLSTGTCIVMDRRAVLVFEQWLGAHIL